MKCASVIYTNRSEDYVQSQREPPEDSDKNENQNKILNKYVRSIFKYFFWVVN